MKIIAEETYHIYNQGNNHETLFYEHSDYIEFLNLFKKFVLKELPVLLGLSNEHNRYQQVGWLIAG